MPGVIDPLVSRFRTCQTTRNSTKPQSTKKEDRARRKHVSRSPDEALLKSRGLVIAHDAAWSAASQFAGTLERHSRLRGPHTSGLVSIRKRSGKSQWQHERI